MREARLLRDEARIEIGRGGDPARRKREERIAAYIRAGDTFEAVAFEYIAKREAEGLAMATLVKNNWLASVLSKSIGHRPIAEITSTKCWPFSSATSRGGLMKRHGAYAALRRACSDTRCRRFELSTIHVRL